MESFAVITIFATQSRLSDWVAKVVFLIQILIIFGGHCINATFDIQLKIYGLPNFDILFQLVLTTFFKSELFLCLSKVDHLIN